MRKNNLTSLRSQLQKKEEELRSTIDEQSSKIEKALNHNGLKLAAVGAGLVVGYFVYKSFSSPKKRKEEKRKSKFSVSSVITKRIISDALKTLMPLVISKIQNKEEKSAK